MKILLVCAALVLWNLAGYPLLILILSGLVREKTSDPEMSKCQAPTPTVLIAAYNEARHIGDRVRNAFQSASVPVEVIVVSDGSTDATAEVAAEAGAVVLKQPRAGKVAALHLAVQKARGDLLILTDANTNFAEGAIDALIEAMTRSDVGIAAGDLAYENSDQSGSSLGESAYWRYETAIKKAASRCGVLLMGAGGIYAVRKSDWPKDLPHDFADDSFVPLSLARAGLRNVFVESARAYERAGTTKHDEWRRRVRMVAQDFRVASSLMFGLPNLRIFLAFISQKLLRWLLFPLIVGIVVGAVRTDRVFRFAVSAWENAAAITAVAALFTLLIILSKSMRRGCDALIYLLGATVAAFVGLVLGFFGRSRSTWSVAATTRGTEAS